MMRVLLLLALALNLFAADCEHCEQKFQDAFFYYEGVKALHVGDNTAISIEKPKKNFLYNPFLSIYLIKNVKHSQSVDLMFPFKEKEVGLFKSGQKPQEVTFTKQCGLREFAKSSVKPGKFSIFSGLCCHVLGLSNRFYAIFDSKYLKDFVERRSTTYGDIGVRFSDSLEIKYINPFFYNSLQVGDKILNYSLCELEEKILFAKPGSTIKLKIKRANKTFNVDVKVHKRHGGGYVSDTFLEQFGMQFNSNLEVAYIIKNSTAQKKGFKVGDKFLRVNNKPLKSQEDFKRLLTQKTDDGYNFLLERDDFQFFINFQP